MSHLTEKSFGGNIGNNQSFAGCQEGISFFWPFGEMTVGEMTVVEMSMLLKCPLGKCLCWQNVQWAKCPVGEMSVLAKCPGWRNVRG